MFDNFTSAPFSDLDEETRLKLADLIEARNNYMNHIMVLNSMKIDALRAPDPTKDARIADYSSALIAPIRTHMSELTTEMLERAVDVEKVKALLPMLLLVATQAVNLPVLMMALGLDPDQFTFLIGKIKDAISDNMG
jgi:hypothetical protein